METEADGTEHREEVLEARGNLNSTFLPDRFCIACSDSDKWGIIYAY